VGRRRRKPRLFAFSRDVELSNYERVPLEPSERRALEAVVDAFAAICDVNALSPETLTPITDGARHPSPIVRGAAFTRLSVLCHYFDVAHPIMAALCADDDEELRLHATAVLSNTPAAMAVPMLARASADPSWRVRKAAASVACAVPWPELDPVLVEAEAREADARVKIVIKLAREHLAQREAEIDDDLFG